MFNTYLPLYFLKNLIIPQTVNPKSPLAYNFKNCNFDDISLFSSNIDFDFNLNNNLSSEAFIEIFYEIIYHFFSLLVGI